MNNLKIFNNPSFGEVRTTVINNDVWFVAKDVCDCLEINNSRQALSRLDGDEKADVILNDGSQNRSYSTVNEYGLYTLVLSSRKPEAKEFKRWITHEVIPSIRKHGAYMTDDVLKQALQSPDFLIQLATELKEEKQARLLAEAKVKEQEPKVIFANAVSVSHTNILIGELAKILKQNGVQDMGQNRLFARLRKDGYLIGRKEVLTIICLHKKQWN